jgi:hypothetical protein
MWHCPYTFCIYPQIDIKMKKYPLLFVGQALLASTTTLAHDWDASRADSHAPISVMGDHTHKAGEFMISVRSMHMAMSGLLDGEKSISTDDALTAYQQVNNKNSAIVPTEMTMDMLMLGGMYASSDKTTWLFMLPYIENKMDMTMRMDMPSMESMPMPQTSDMSMKSHGIGDLKIGALHNIVNNNGHRVHLNLNLSLPTGSIDEKNNNNDVMAYRMQLGSGTYDVLPGITYTAQNDFMSWGSQAIATIRTGSNKRDYTLGNRYTLQGWLQKPLFQHISLTARLAYEKWQNIDGEDQDLSMMKRMSPIADPTLQGGSLATAGFGANITLPEGHRLAFEYTTELDQDLNGPQLSFDDSLVFAWQLAF